MREEAAKAVIVIAALATWELWLPPAIRLVNSLIVAGLQP